MGIRGTVRRSTDGHIIHANIDTDIIISEEPSYGKYDTHLIYHPLLLRNTTSSLLDLDFPHLHIFGSKYLAIITYIYIYFYLCIYLHLYVYVYNR